MLGGVRMPTAECGRMALNQCPLSAVASTGGVDGLPLALVTDEHGLVQGVQSLGQGEAGRSRPSTPPRRPPRSRTGPARSEWTGTAPHGRKWCTRPGQVSTGSFSLPDGHLKGVQGQVGVQVRGGLPPDDPPRVHVVHESHIDPAGEGAHVGGGTSSLRGNVGDPQLIGSKRLEVALDQVGRALLSRRAARGARGLGTPDAVQAQVCHEPFDGAPGHVTGTVTLGDLRTVKRHVHLAGPQHRAVGSCGPWISPP